jgi:hypothetical protein
MPLPALKQGKGKQGGARGQGKEPLFERQEFKARVVTSYAEDKEGWLKGIKCRKVTEQLNNNKLISISHLLYKP